MFTKRDFLRSAALASITASMANSVLAQAQTNPSWPNLFEAKAIAAHFADGERRFQAIVSSCFARW
ncbi:hypothetical protein IVB42_12710 [Bradyrhizobium sp. 45]|jgi:hypothetical protein|nr:hypothetical protein [Bradyrhizobium sp. 45]